MSDPVKTYRISHLPEYIGSNPKGLHPLFLQDIAGPEKPINDPCSIAAADSVSKETYPLDCGRIIIRVPFIQNKFRCGNKIAEGGQR